MQETNNFTNLTRLSSFLLLDMLLLIDMTWNTHLSAKNTERKRNILGDLETREESIGKRRRSWTMLDLTGFRLMRRVAHGRSRSLACRESRRTSPSETQEAQHGRTIAFALQQWHVAFSGGWSLFTNWAGLFFCFVSFLLFFLFFAFFFFFWNATAYFAQFAIRGYALDWVISVGQTPKVLRVRCSFGWAGRPTIALKWGGRTSQAELKRCGPNRVRCWCINASVTCDPRQNKEILIITCTWTSEWKRGLLLDHSIEQHYTGVN